MDILFKPSSIKSWDEGLSVGVELKENLDQTHISLGVLANHLCPVRKVGNPKWATGRRGSSGGVPDFDGAEATITGLANAIGVDRTWLSNAANNALFWDEHLDDIPVQASIGQLNAARKLVGWKPGIKVTAAMRKEALRYLQGLVEPDEADEPEPLDFVKSARAKLRKALLGDPPLKGDDKDLVEKAQDNLNTVVSRHDD